MAQQQQQPQNGRQRREGFLDRMDPRTRRYVTIGAVVAVAVLAIWSFTRDDTPRRRGNEVTAVLTDKSSRDMGIESLLAQIKIANDNVSKLEGELRKVTREQELARSENAENRRAISRVSRLEKDFQDTTSDMRGQIEVLSANLTKANETNAMLQRIIEGSPELQERLDSIQSSGQGTQAAEDADTGTAADDSADVSGDGGNRRGSSSAGSGRPSFDEIAGQFRQNRPRDYLTDPVDLNDPEALFASLPVLPGTAQVTGADGSVTDVPLASLRTNFISEAEPETDPAAAEAEKEPEMFIPAGSMMKGVLLAGLDAPTGTDARKDPFPVNVRIQTDTVLPNGYTADLKECFLLMSGYGDMSSERALLRGETLSCIKDDGSIIQTKLPSYAAGEDGKAGLRGRLVSKTGSILAKTLLAGFASGVSEAFDVSMTPTINTSSDGTVSYEQVYAPEAFQGAAISGVSNALDRLADYYMSMAEEMFPIIEIDGGRELTVIVSNGASLTTVRDGSGRPVDQGTDTVTAQAE